MLGLFDGLLVGLGDFEGLFDGLLLGLLDGLGDFDGLFDGLLDGLLLGLLLGLGLEVADGLGLLVALLDGRGLLLAELLLGELDAECPPVSKVAVVAAVVPRPHGEPAARADDASAGAITIPVARNDPANTAVATLSDLPIPTGTTTLPRAVRLRPYLRA